MSLLTFLLWILLGVIAAYIVVCQIFRRTQVRLPHQKLRYLQPYQPPVGPSSSEAPCE